MANKQAKESLSKIKNEAAQTVGVTLKQGYNGDLTSKQAGSIGGEMVKKMLPKQHFEFSRSRRELHDTIVVVYDVHISIPY